MLTVLYFVVFGASVALYGRRQALGIVLFMGGVLISVVLSGLVIAELFGCDDPGGWSRSSCSLRAFVLSASVMTIINGLRGAFCIRLSGLSKTSEASFSFSAMLYVLRSIIRERRN